MRKQLLKLKKGQSTKSERIFSEILKNIRIPFKTKVRIKSNEVDFLIKDKFIIEINGHEQSPERNNEFIRLGYVPMHFHNQEIINNREVITKYIKLCLQELI
ncbi:MAG TPA: DUF559 domain-containing protein [Candidatus Pelethenecus sp.]|nr:DUF559 domain-containing protein [Candidatus Pelethenecus sp.]